jgi:hypothetical protein
MNNEPMFWGCIFTFAVFSVVGVGTYFLFSFVMGLFLNGDNDVIAIILAFAAMLSAALMLNNEP